MRLRLKLALGGLGWLFCGASLASGQPAPEVEAQLNFYADDDRVTVVSPAVQAALPLSENWKGLVQSQVDVVSAASVDVLTSASPGAVRDTRVELGAGALWSPSLTRRLTGRVIGSHENDYDSVQLALGAGVELFERNLVLEFGWLAAVDRVGKATDPDFVAQQRGQRLVVSATQLLGPRTVADGVVEVGLTEGYLASPYRTVPLLDSGQPQILRVPEALPERRLEGAVLVRLRQALDASGRFALAGSYRGYADDWQVVSHTGSLQLSTNALADTLLALQLRAYHQSAASFYQARYGLSPEGQPPSFRTRDQRLGGMSSLQLSLTGDWRVGGKVRLLGSCGGVRFLYHHYPFQRERLALTTGVGLAVDL